MKLKPVIALIAIAYSGALVSKIFDVPQMTQAAQSRFEIDYFDVTGIPVRDSMFIDGRQLHCMALNMYFEARNQRDSSAMAAVGYTVMNRVHSGAYPDTICDVVFKGRRDGRGNLIRNKCQFSWACDGKADIPDTTNVIENRAWERANQVAYEVITGKAENPVGNAVMYHADYVSPDWATDYQIVAKIDDHVFYQSTSI